MKTTYTVAPIGKGDVVILDAQTGATKSEIRVVDDGEILTVTSSDNSASVTYKDGHGNIHNTLIELPNGRMHGLRKLADGDKRFTPRPRAQATQPAMQPVGLRRYQGGGEGLVFLLVGGYIAYSCVEAGLLTMWNWVMVAYNFYF